jgi:V/A-type H+-transporting ATPase subunit E
MAVDDILKKIRADAEEAARAIEGEGKKAAEEVLRSARDEVEARKKEFRLRAEQRASEERNRVVTLARLAARRELLEAKQALIERVFDEAQRAVEELEGDEYRELMEKLLSETVETGDEEVLVGESEERIDQAFLDRVSRKLGKGKGLKLSRERRRVRGGFILRQGRVETNCALETIFKDARERLETEVAAILFGGASEN